MCLANGHLPPIAYPQEGPQMDLHLQSRGHMPALLLTFAVLMTLFAPSPGQGSPSNIDLCNLFLSKEQADKYIYASSERSEGRYKLDRFVQYLTFNSYGPPDFLMGF